MGLRNLWIKTPIKRRKPKKTAAKKPAKKGLDAHQKHLRHLRDIGKAPKKTASSGRSRKPGKAASPRPATTAA